MWFEQLAGFREDEVDRVADRFRIDGTTLTSLANGRTFTCGTFEPASLGELRTRADRVVSGRDRAGTTLTVREVVADVQQLHRDPVNAGALFQVASQFNTLEMVSPSVRPEDGIDRYELDRTQGPACAVACGAGTIQRNYLVEVNGQRGQSADSQIDCLADLATALDETIEMSNGYAFPSPTQLERIAQSIPADDRHRDLLLGSLRIGMQWNTEVTLARLFPAVPADGPAGSANDADVSTAQGGHLVTQAYCSALPVAYSTVPTDAWEPFARLVLDAAYEATLAAAIVNADATGNNQVFLTLLGGGVFGNPVRWILSAIDRAIDRTVERWADHGLDVAIVSHGRHNPALASLHHQLHVD